MDLIEVLKFILKMLCAPPDLFFSWFFGFAPDVLKIMCVSMLIVTIGKNLKFYERKTYHVIKGLLYIWFLLYLAYVLEYFDISKEYDSLDWISLGISIIAPLCMLILWSIGKRWLNNALPFDVYYIGMTIYGLIGLWWAIFKPDMIVTEFFFFYEGLLLISVYICSKLCGGVMSIKDENFWKRVLTILKIIGFSILIGFLELIILPLDPENRLFPVHIEIWTVGLCGIGLFGILSIFYYQTEYKKYFVLLMLGSLSLLFVDIEDFLGIFSTGTGIIVFILILFILAMILYLYTKRAKEIGISLLISLIFSISYVLIINLNNEKLVENWMLGLWFSIIFIILYLLPPGKLWTIIKRVHFLMILFWISLFLFDINDFASMFMKIYF